MYRTVVIAGLVVAVIAGVLQMVSARRAKSAQRRALLWERVVFVVLLLSVIGLACTAWWAVVVKDRAMSGLPLLIHTAVGGLFAVALAIGIVPCAARCRFSGTASGWDKLFFWALGGGGLVALVTILLSMFPWFGTEGMKCLMEVHRYSALVVVMAAVGKVLALVGHLRAGK